MRRPVVLALLLVLGVGGCGSVSAPSLNALRTVPADFTVDVAVMRGSGVAARSDAHLRVSRAVVFPDGSLHWAADDALGANDLPAIRRILDERRLSELWTLVQELGLADLSRAESPSNLELLKAGESEYVYLIVITANDARWMQIARFADGQIPPASEMKLIRHLSRLAWATDLPEEEASVEVHRYDFGPDPYARYRQGGVRR